MVVQLTRREKELRIEMNRIALALLVCLVVVVLSGCQPAADTNRNLAVSESRVRRRRRLMRQPLRPN